MANFSNKYKPSPTFKRFHRDGQDVSAPVYDDKTGELIQEGRNYVRCVMGPVGSGKTVGCIQEVFLQCCRQWKNPKDDTRHSRVAIVRDTYKNLKQTTIETFLQWFPEGVLTRLVRTPPIKMYWDFDLAPDDHVKVEFVCVALDSPSAMEDLKSNEFSGAFVNECVAINPDVINMLIQRVGRWPGGLEDPDGNTKSFIVMDTNPPNIGNWYQVYKDEIHPDNWKFYDQPPALLFTRDPKTGKYSFKPNTGQKPGVPPAENIRFLKEGFGYYMKTAQTADPMYTLVYNCMQYGEVGQGTAVYSQYDDSIHCAQSEIPFNPRYPLFLGFDYGLTPSCVVAQYTPYGQLQVLDEIFKVGIGSVQFIETYVLPTLINKYKWGEGVKVIAVGDPAGSVRKDTDEKTNMDILHQYNIPVVACLTNALLPRLESVRYFLNSMARGEPAFKLSPNCAMLRRGFQGLYKYETVRGDNVRLREEPCKNEYSHSQDALQYIAHRIRFANEYGGGMSLFGREEEPLKGNLSIGRMNLAMF